MVQTQKRRGCLWIGGTLFGVALLMAMISQTVSPPAADKSKLAASSTAPVGRLSNPADQIKILSYSASKGGFDNVMILTMKLRNDNSFAVKDFQIVCANYAPSGTELPASFGTLYEKLEPGEIKAFKKINLGLMPPDSSSYKCAIAVAKQVKPG
jgi:hypothetical protein